ncbi:neuraminidase-like domain-containing protein [Paenibacillus peoriae]|uniref:Tc toxin subunit A-related protein n=1 Tax=Paenibacillus peoriae TaxID=59893 RepID=UPI003D27C227
MIIQVRDASFEDQNGKGIILGEAKYVAPLPIEFPKPHPKTQIYQHYQLVPFPPDICSFAVATAVVALTLPTNIEHQNIDVQIVIKWNSQTIEHKQIYYNAPIYESSKMVFNQVQKDDLPTSIYLPIPPFDRMTPLLSLSEEGAPPPFNNLKAAVETVLNKDTGNTSNLAVLEYNRCIHIAREISCDAAVFPLPRPLGAMQSWSSMYTTPSNDDKERNRRSFEAELLSYYTTHNSNAERLANFIFALSTALSCEAKSIKSTEAILTFPLLLNPDREVSLRLKAAAPNVLSSFLEVPAPYFYALTANLPPQMNVEERYEMSSLLPEEQLLSVFKHAVTEHIIDNNLLIGPAQAARRLHAIGTEGRGDLPECPIDPKSSIFSLVSKWFAHKDNIDAFWAGMNSADKPRHYDLLLSVITKGDEDLVTAIKSPPFDATDAEKLKKKIADDWKALFQQKPDIIPKFTEPGTNEERVEAFIGYLKRFFSVEKTTPQAANVLKEDAPGLKRPSRPLPDLDARIKGVKDLTIGIKPNGLRFAVMEGLWARGFTSAEHMKGLNINELSEALTGSIAYDWVQKIWDNAQTSPLHSKNIQEGFNPVNSDGGLINCVSPEQLSPFGPIAYLQELLQTVPDKTGGNSNSLGTLLADRRGPLGNLLASKANMYVPLPMIDLVNESLEYMVACRMSHGQVYDTTKDEIGGHLLTSSAYSKSEIAHEPTTLFEALPEHSTPAVNTDEKSAYHELRTDFSSHRLPYSQPLDVARTYLEALGSSRYTVMRHFRKKITEFVLSPNQEPLEFNRSLWRYPVRFDTAREYLLISPEEYQTIYQDKIVFSRDGRLRSESNKDKVLLHDLYGYDSSNGSLWMDDVVKLSEFLCRTGLSYCKFLELWKSGFVEFRAKGKEGGCFPDCEPCNLNDYQIDFKTPADQADALKRLAVFIRLWRTLQAVPQARYTFTQLRDICQVLKLFDVSRVNPEFIRQLAAFQMLRDDFNLSLSDGATNGERDVACLDDASIATGAERMRLLALWVPEAWKKEGYPDSSNNPLIRAKEWALNHLLQQIEQHAINNFNCGCREPKFLKIFKSNLKSLAVLAGFESRGVSNDAWHAAPTHTLRFAEILAKIYASEFGIGELLFLFGGTEQRMSEEPCPLLAADELHGDDPFPLQSANEAKDSPLGLPDDEDQFSLLSLRHQLMEIDASDEDAKHWTWTRMEASLRDEFGYAVQPDEEDSWLCLGQHFFPTVLSECGLTVEPLQRMYSASLDKPTKAGMWNTPLDGPFRYHSDKLWTEIPLSDEAVLTKLSRIRQLDPHEQKAVTSLYYAPRLELAKFAFLFANYGETEDYLIQEPDEQKRWARFQKEFTRFHRRCVVIAVHLTSHIAQSVGVNRVEVGLAKLILKHLWADENKAISTLEQDNGQFPPMLTWNLLPSAGAYSALLGLVGTGMQVDYTDGDQNLRWREVRGGTEVFGAEENMWNAPVPMIIPSFDTKFTGGQERFAVVRNGYAMANHEGRILGGAEAYSLHWHGLLLIENRGDYSFSAGSPTPTGQLPDASIIDEACSWHITLKRGQKSWVLLSGEGQGNDNSVECSTPIELKKGFYELDIVFRREALAFDGPEDICPQRTGFQFKYYGPDTEKVWRTIPLDKLFQELKDDPLSHFIPDAQVPDKAKAYLEQQYTSTLRDIRRTYQRAYKAMLFAARLGLSARKIADDGQAELGYMLENEKLFSGQSYLRDTDHSFKAHKADFNFNFLPVFDNYAAPSATQDERAYPSTERRQAMFDWWERLFDYTVMRTETNRSPEQPAWLLFHESLESHEDIPGHLVRHLGIDMQHAELVLHYFISEPEEIPPKQQLVVTSDQLADERWALRVWQSEKWIRELMRHFFSKDIAEAKPYLWAADDPSEPVGVEDSGNDNLTRFYRDGCIENEQIRQYEKIKRLNDGLRERGRAGLVAYLTHMKRVPLPWGGFAEDAKHLSELLLVDVEAGICETSSRIEEALTAIRLLVQRVRLGLEPYLSASARFMAVWDYRFSHYHSWKAHRTRFYYNENWIEWDELQEARQTEAFQSLESELRRSSLSIVKPTESVLPIGSSLPAHPGIVAVQNREFTVLDHIEPGAEGLRIQGTLEHQFRPTWLTPEAELPMWFKAAVKLGNPFIRIAAAGMPPAGAEDIADCTKTEPMACCKEFSKTYPVRMDEYYFWIDHARVYKPQTQDAECGTISANPESDWQRPDKLPVLLHWESEPMVHLCWCRVHNGQFQQPRQSHEGVMVIKGMNPEIVFIGRWGDSLYFEVKGGSAAPGHSMPLMPGFRYDLAMDEALALPNVVVPKPDHNTFPPAYPFFAWFKPGSRLLPSTMFSSVIAIAGQLRAHCQYEAALKWYEMFYNPLKKDNRWGRCPPAHPSVLSNKERAILLHYTETLVQWGDALLRGNSPEDLHQARLIFATADKILGEAPATILEDTVNRKETTVTTFNSSCAPINPRLLSLYTNVADRLALIHSCLDASRLKSSRQSYYADGFVSRGSGNRTCYDDEWCVPANPYRFIFLNQKAQELASDVQSLGHVLLAAYEKGDSESLVAMHAMHEKQAVNLALEVKQNQWRDADWQEQALKKTKEMLTARLRYYKGLIATGLIGGERQYDPRITMTTKSLDTGTNYEGRGMSNILIPDPYVGCCSFSKLATGTKTSMYHWAYARIAYAQAETFQVLASHGVTLAGWQRREQEWQHQTELLKIEIEQVDRQILATQRRKDIALREVNNQQQQIKNCAERSEFLRDKFTNHELYLWLQQETAAMYYQMYEIGLHYARQAQKAFNYERGHSTRQFIPSEIWDHLREGLMAGERLHLAVRQMEKTYFAENVREYELIKHIPLRTHFPMEFLQLLVTGSCEIDIPEWMFDLDYPGHYMRRIKNVTLTVLCEAEAYSGIHCRLTLLSSKTRIDPRLVVPTNSCCRNERYKNGYQTMPDDERTVSVYAAREAIATSSGIRDSGMFELNFQDERYLPFEFAGAVSRWRIELPHENNPFDIESLSDLILHLSYTAREGGDNLRHAANECARECLPGFGVRLFDAKQDIPDANPFTIRLSRSMFPFITSYWEIGVYRFEFLFRVPKTFASDHCTVEFLPGQFDEPMLKNHHCIGKEEMQSVICVANEQRPELYHGVIELKNEVLVESSLQDIGKLRFPDEAGNVKDIYVFCWYRRR